MNTGEFIVELICKYKPEDVDEETFVDDMMELCLHARLDAQSEMIENFSTLLKIIKKEKE